MKRDSDSRRLFCVICENSYWNLVYFNLGGRLVVPTSSITHCAHMLHLRHSYYATKAKRRFQRWFQYTHTLTHRHTLTSSNAVQVHTITLRVLVLSLALPKRCLTPKSDRTISFFLLFLFSTFSLTGRRSSMWGLSAHRPAAMHA